MERLTSEGQGKLTRPAYSALSKARAAKAREAHHEADAAKRKARRKARAEFAKWKREIVALVQGESRIVFSDDGKDWTFVVPQRLVRFVFALMVKEYMASKGARTEDEARAMIRADVKHAAAKVEGQGAGRADG